MIVDTTESWESKEWVEIVSRVKIESSKYKPGFLEWLKLRPALWSRLSHYALTASTFQDSEGFSIVCLIHIVTIESADTDPEYLQDVDLKYARDLGLLLIDIYPETADCLWNGEIYSQVTKHELVDLAEEIERNKPDLAGFFLVGDNDPAHGEENMVFPEIKRLNSAELKNIFTAH